MILNKAMFDTKELLSEAVYCEYKDKLTYRFVRVAMTVHERPLPYYEEIFLTVYFEVLDAINNDGL